MNTETIDCIFSSLQVMNETVKTNAEKCVANEFYRMKNEILNGLVNNMVCNFKVLGWELQKTNEGVIKHALVEYITPSGKTYVFHRPLNKRNSFNQCLEFVGMQVPESDEEWTEYNRNETQGSTCDVFDLPLLAKWYQMFKIQRYLEISLMERTKGYLKYATNINNSIKNSNELFDANITINDIFRDMKMEFNLSNAGCKNNDKNKLKSLLLCKGRVQLKSFE